MSAVMTTASQGRMEWRVVPLSQVCAFKPAKSICRKQLADDAEVSFVPMNDLGELVKYFEPQDVRAFGEVVKSYTYFADGDVLCAKITPCFENGKLGVARNLRNGIGFGSSEFVVMRASGEILPEYLYYFLSRDSFREAGARVMSGAVGHKRVPNEYFENLLVPLPPLKEQKRIVAVLDQAFAALDRARVHAEANQADAQELFDNTLLAVFDELLPTATMMTLGEAALDFSRGKSRHRPRNDPALYDGNYPFIQTGDIRRSEGSIREHTQTYNDAGLAQSKLWPVGTVCITIAANIAETGVLEFEACFPDSVIGMVPDPAIADAYYAEYMLRYFAKELKLQGKGSAQDNINLATFENAKFPFPTLEQQVRVVDKLDAMTEAVGSLRTRYQQKLADLATLRQSLLQKAFAGELA